MYYDQRGRHGFVNHLDTVFINGYNSTERQGNLHGAAHVKSLSSMTLHLGRITTRLSILEIPLLEILFSTAQEALL